MSCSEQWPKLELGATLPLGFELVVTAHLADACQAHQNMFQRQAWAVMVAVFPRLFLWFELVGTVPLVGTCQTC